MERLTSREPRLSGMPGVCCTHFEGRDCQAIQGRCADGCVWEEAAWERLAEYEDTGRMPAEITSLIPPAMDGIRKAVAIDFDGLYKKELLSHSEEIISFLRSQYEHQGDCEGCPWYVSETGVCFLCRWTKCSADLLEMLVQERGLKDSSPDTDKPMPKPCSECGEKMYLCKNCRWHSWSPYYDSRGGIYEKCRKFEVDCNQIRERAFPGKRCPCWELPEEVRFCKTCGRLLK